MTNRNRFGLVFVTSFGYDEDFDLGSIVANLPRDGINSVWPEIPHAAENTTPCAD